MAELKYVNRHLKELKVSGRKPKTIYERRRLLYLVNDALPWGVDEASDEEILEYFDGAHTDGWAPSTRFHYWNTLRVYYRWATRHSLLTMDPMLNLKAPSKVKQLPDPVSEDDLALAVERSPEQPWRMCTMLAAYAGLRACELVTQLREDCNEDSLLVRHGKGDKARWVEMSPVLWDYIKDAPPGPLVRGKLGGQLKGSTIVQDQHKHWVSVGLPQIHMHRFRHRFATELLRQGVDIRVIQVLMGHESLTSTEIYTLVVSAQRTAAVKLLPSLLTRNTLATQNDVLGEHRPAINRPVPPTAEAA